MVPYFMELCTKSGVSNVNVNANNYGNFLIWKWFVLIIGTNYGVVYGMPQTHRGAVYDKSPLENYLENVEIWTFFMRVLLERLRFHKFYKLAAGPRTTVCYAKTHYKRLKLSQCGRINFLYLTGSFVVVPTWNTGGTG